MASRKAVIYGSIISASRKYFSDLEEILDLIQDNDDEDNLALLIMETFKRNHPIRISAYIDKVVRNYMEKEFQQNFRINRNAFEKLLEITTATLGPPATKPYKSLEKDLLAVIWLLATPDSYRSVGERFDMGKSSLSKAFERIISILNKIAHNIIKWPEHEDLHSIKEKFEKMGGLKKVIGCVDGTYIKIDAPPEHPEEYINRKCFHGITLQAICNNELQFTDCFVGFPSSVHDVRIFRNSDIYKDINQNINSFCPNQEILLGDKAYPCMIWCIPPYKDNGRLTQQQKYFNLNHAKTRQVIERAFGLLFGRFRRLKHLQMKRIDLVPKTVLAACVLHNICLSFEDENIESYIREGIEHARTNCDDSSANNGIRTENPTEAYKLRDEICAQIFNANN